MAAHSSGGGKGGGVAGYKVWDIELDKVIHIYDHTGHSWTRCDFVTDKLGHILATDAFNMNLAIWSLPSFDIIRPIPRAGSHTGSNGIACSPDGTTIAVANLNRTKGEIKDKKMIIIPRLVLIDVGSGGIKPLNYSGYISSLAFSPDGNYIASAGQNGEVCIWDVNPASFTFGQCLDVLGVKMSCHGMLISGAHGLEREITWRDKGAERKGMLIELFADCGAVLDEEQRRNLTEMRKQRNEE